MYTTFKLRNYFPLTGRLLIYDREEPYVLIFKINNIRYFFKGANHSLTNTATSR
jgi:hypothetical protein